MRNVTRPAPRFVRVTVGGALADWPEPGPAAHLKIFIPEMRTYTVRRFDRSAGEVDIDVYLHEGNGAAARWADAVGPGAELELSGRSRSTFAAHGDTEHYLFAGDPSALPAIATCLEALPATARATVVTTTGELPFEPGRAELRVAPGDDVFVAAVREVDADRAWVACEATVMRRIRTALLDRYGRERLATRGYWKRGEVNHPDHDTGDDE